jgi:predicted nucleotide-binding protein
MATLKVTRQEAAHVLSAHGEEGNALLALATELPNEPAYQGWRHNRTRWIKRTEEALKHTYDGADAAKEFVDAAYPKVALGGASQWEMNLRFDCEYVGDAINTLISLSERLQYADEPPLHTTAPASSGASDDPVVFLVHGHDTGMRETVARFLEKNGPDDVDVVILEEQADKGRTVLEKLEDHAAASKYAVVLATPDDVGRAKDGEEQPRARQNVIFEFGWFCGLLGREHVAVLHDPGVELPSDLNGLVYIPLDNEWQNRLVRELKASGLNYHS